MEKSNDMLINPIIKVPRSACPKCYGTIYVADSELSIMEISDEGKPISEETVIKCRGVCSKCGHKMDMFRWDGGYLPDTDVVRAHVEFQRKYKAQQRVKSLNESVDLTNPFMINKGE